MRLVNILFVAVALIASACDSPNPNADKLFGGAPWGGTWGEGTDHTSFTAHDLWVIGESGATNTYCAYNMTYDWPVTGQKMTVTVTASNNHSDSQETCLAIGTYSCLFSGTTAQVCTIASSPVTLSIACDGQPTINLWR